MTKNNEVGNTTTTALLNSMYGVLFINAEKVENLMQMCLSGTFDQLPKLSSFHWHMCVLRKQGNITLAIQCSRGGHQKVSTKRSREIVW